MEYNILDYRSNNDIFRIYIKKIILFYFINIR